MLRPKQIGEHFVKHFKTIHERSISKFDQKHYRLFIMVQLIGLTMGWEQAVN